MIDFKRKEAFYASQEVILLKDFYLFQYPTTKSKRLSFTSFVFSVSTREITPEDINSHKCEDTKTLNCQHNSDKILSKTLL